MRHPEARLNDVIPLKNSENGETRLILMLDQLTSIPEIGDILFAAGHNFEITDVSKQQTRSCLMGWPLKGLGSIGVAVNGDEEKLRAFARQTPRPRVTWTSKDALGWAFTDHDLPVFHHLNTGWNADPNAPDPRIELEDRDLLVTFAPNRYQFRRYEGLEEITLQFRDCSRYRITPINDHGWYGRQCRFSSLAPAWGEFYEITGYTRDALEPTPWAEAAGKGDRHFHFYFRDETLEVKAGDWNVSPMPDDLK